MGLLSSTVIPLACLELIANELRRICRLINANFPKHLILPLHPIDK